MVNKTYSLSAEDESKLISYVCRYKHVSTSINEKDDYLLFLLIIISNDYYTVGAYLTLPLLYVNIFVSLKPMSVLIGF